MAEITEKEFWTLLDAANAGAISEQIRVGDCYREGLGVEQDVVQAFKWYMKAAQQGSSKGEDLVGCCYEEGIGVDKDNVKAFEWYLKAAEQGLRKGEYDTGRCFSSGIGVDRNEYKAFEWFMKAAEQGYPAGEYSLGNCYYYGGVERDEDKAFELFMRSANQGLAIAEYRIGDCYSKGIGVQKDDTKALEWYIKGSEHGNPLLLCTPGICYLKGKGTERNEEEAFKWFMKSAKKGNSYGEALVGICFNEGLGVKKDKVEAFKWFLESAKKGNKLGEFHVGSCYCLGKGVEKDGEKAFYWFQKASKNYEGGTLGKAHCYLEGIGVEQDYSKAFELLMSIKHSNPDIEDLIGSCYNKGVGVEKNKEKALEWYTRAIEHGSLRGKMDAGFLFLNSKEYDRALEYFNNPKEYIDISYFKFCKALYTLTKIGRNSKELRQKVEKVFEETSSISYPSIELFEHLLVIDYSKSDQCQKLIELCEKHKEDSGGWAYFILSMYSGLFDQTHVLNGVVEKNNVLSYAYRRKALEYGFPFTEIEQKKYYRNSEILDDYEMIDAKIKFDSGDDYEKLGKSIEKQCRRFLKTDSLPRIMEEMVGTHSLLEFMFSKTLKWNVERKPEFSSKIHNDIFSVGGSYRKRIDDPAVKMDESLEFDKADKDVNHLLTKLSEEEECADFISLSAYIGHLSDSELKNKIAKYCSSLGKGARDRVFNKIRYKEISYGDIQGDDGETSDFFELIEDPVAGKIGDIAICYVELLPKIEIAIAQIDKSPNIRKCKKAPASCIIASYLYTYISERLLKTDPTEVFELIRPILEKTNTFNYDLSSLCQLYLDKKGIVKDSDICELIGIKRPSYSRTKNETILPLIEKYIEAEANNNNEGGNNNFLD